MGIKITRSWLDSVVGTKLTNTEIGDKLTSCGIEIDEIIDLKPDLSGVVTGYVKSIEQHPNADRLKVCQVAINDHEVKKIVCGCSSVKAGIHVAVATIGAVLPGGFKIKKSKLRGIESEGMLCSLKELGVSEVSNGIVHLGNVTTLGTDIIKHLNLDDVVFDFDVTPNRGDCLSLKGLARELVAFSDSNLKEEELYELATPTGTMPFKLNVLAKDAVPIYSGAYITNINVVSDNKYFVNDVLTKIDVPGIISPIDLANYLMFESGQPFHVFDADLIDGDITVRYAKKNEQIKVLTGACLELDESVLVIADNTKVLAIAGVIGADSVAVSENTKNIFVESAYFKAEVIANTCRKYNLTSDSSFRFERGIDYANTIKVCDKLVALLLDSVGGKYEARVNFNHNLPQKKPAKLTLAYVRKVLGFDLTINEVDSCLNKIGAEFTKDNDAWLINSPSWRHDLNIEVDYIEELLRFRGYDNLPGHKLTVNHTPTGEYKSLADNVNHARSTLMSRGLREVVAYSFISEDDYAHFNEINSALKLLNPISSNMGFMRSTLISGLLKSASHNFKRQKTNIRLFEIGQCFMNDGSTNEKLASLYLGDNLTNNWQDKSRRYNFFDVKGELESLLNSYGSDYSFVANEKLGFHPGQCANIVSNDKICGFIAAIHPNVAKYYDLPEDIYVFEIDNILLSRIKEKNYTAYSKFPGVRRDLSLIVSEDSVYSDLQFTIWNAAKPLLQDIKLFDVYVDSNMKKGQKSLAISLFFQHDTRTLQDDEVNVIMDNITINLKNMNIHVRV